MNSNTKKEDQVQRLVLLSNRWGDHNYLRHIDGRKYRYEGEDNYLRVGYKDLTEGEEITFIDPPGGPFMSVGGEVFGIEGTISKIEALDKGFMLEFE